MDENQKRALVGSGWGSGLGIGMGVGVALGVAMHNMGVGIAIGIAIAFIFGASFTAAAMKKSSGQAPESTDS
jgi:hypothetical protein